MDATPKPPTIQQYVDILNGYNAARTLELRLMPPAGFPKDYKNEHMDNFYDCAAIAAGQLKLALAADLEIGNRKSEIGNQNG